MMSRTTLNKAKVYVEREKETHVSRLYDLYSEWDDSQVDYDAYYFEEYGREPTGLPAREYEYTDDGYIAEIHKEEADIKMCTVLLILLEKELKNVNI